MLSSCEPAAATAGGHRRRKPPSDTAVRHRRRPPPSTTAVGHRLRPPPWATTFGHRRRPIPQSARCPNSHAKHARAHNIYRRTHITHARATLNCTCRVGRGRQAAVATRTSKQTTACRVGLSSKGAGGPAIPTLWAVRCLPCVARRVLHIARCAAWRRTRSAGRPRAASLGWSTRTAA